MAEITGLRNNALPYPVYGAPFGVVFPMLDADGDLVSAATTPDAEVSLNGNTFADCTNESTEIATTSGMWYLLLTAAEMTADVVAVIAKSATAGMKTTPIVLYPRKLVTVRSGTSASAGLLTDRIILDASASTVDDAYNGMVCIAIIDGNVESRIISDYTGSTQRADVVPDWNVAPDATYTFVIKLPEGGHVQDANVVAWLSTIPATPTVAGVPEVDLTHVGGATTNVAALATNVDAIITDTADMQPKLGTPAGASISADILVIDNFVDGLETTIGVAGAGLTDLGGMSTTMKAQVNTEVVDTLNVDTYAEPGQEAPAATTTLARKIGYLYKLLRNRITQDATTLKIYADDATTVDQKATVSDDATTYDRGEIGTGP